MFYLSHPFINPVCFEFNHHLNWPVHRLVINEEYNLLEVLFCEKPVHENNYTVDVIRLFYRRTSNTRDKQVYRSYFDCRQDEKKPVTEEKIWLNYTRKYKCDRMRIEYLKLPDLNDDNCFIIRNIENSIHFVEKVTAMIENIFNVVIDPVVLQKTRELGWCFL